MNISKHTTDHDLHTLLTKLFDLARRLLNGGNTDLTVVAAMMKAVHFLQQGTGYSTTKSDVLNQVSMKIQSLMNAQTNQPTTLSLHASSLVPSIVVSGPAVNMALQMLMNISKHTTDHDLHTLLTNVFGLAPRLLHGVSSVLTVMTAMEKAVHFLQQGTDDSTTNLFLLDKVSKKIQSLMNAQAIGTTKLSSSSTSSSSSSITVSRLAFELAFQLLVIISKHTLDHDLPTLLDNVFDLAHRLLNDSSTDLTVVAAMEKAVQFLQNAAAEAQKKQERAAAAEATKQATEQ